LEYFRDPHEALIEGTRYSKQQNFSIGFLVKTDNVQVQVEADSAEKPEHAKCFGKFELQVLTSLVEPQEEKEEGEHEKDTDKGLGPELHAKSHEISVVHLSCRITRLQGCRVDRFSRVALEQLPQKLLHTWRGWVLLE
jgi:hypothetical protein